MEQLTKYQQEYKDKAQKLANIISKFYSAKVIKGENMSDFSVVFTAKNKTFTITQDWKGYCYVYLYPHKIYNNVSSYKQQELRERDTTKKMKVITKKKLDAKIDIEIAYNDAMEKINKETADNVAKFLAEIKKKYPLVKYLRNYEGDKITGGWIVKNGIEYSFEISNDGYISQKIRLENSYFEDYQKAFNQLSDNKFRK